MIEEKAKVKGRIAFSEHPTNKLQSNSFISLDQNPEYQPQIVTSEFLLLNFWIVNKQMENGNSFTSLSPIEAKKS